MFKNLCALSFILFAVLQANHVLSLNTLEKYNIDASKVTVSGVSSGAAMAVQFHVAHSSLVSGAGSVAGPPYNCAGGLSLMASTVCMNGLGIISLSSIYKSVSSAYEAGLIDNPANLKNSNVYIYSGLLDIVVATTVVWKTEDFYKNYLPSSNVKAVYSVSSAHGFITNNYGYSCSIMGLNYLNNCNYNQAFHITQQLYPKDNVVEPSKDAKPTGTFIEFNQKEFFPSESSSVSMDDTAFVYVPSKCAEKSTKCKLHVAFHGCLQGKQLIGTDFIQHSGFNQVADANDMIVIYPQAKVTVLSNMNPNGCWDWWGYTDKNYANKNGPQIKAIKAMIDRVMGKN